MDRISVDVAIIGAGSAGLNARKEVEREGKSYVLIEGGPYGTTCARVGCMPSKLLIAAADAAHEVRHAGRFGIEVDPGAWRVNAEQVFDRVRRERDRFAGFVVESTEAIDEHLRLSGYARFTSDNTLVVDDHTEVTFATAVIATGSSPWVPPNLEPVADRVLVNDDVFELDAIPERLAVFGTGVIGFELGQALSRLGSNVTFFNPFDLLGPFTDPEVIAKSKAVLGARHDLQLGSRTLEVRPEGDCSTFIRWADASGVEHEEVFNQVLAAAGRRPNLGRLQLEQTSIALDERGMPRTDPRTAQIGESNLFLAGDASGHRPLLHEAADEGRIAGANAARWPDVQATIRRTALAIAFTDPQMALVGKRYADLDPAEIEIGEVSYDDQGRARVMGVNSGLVRIYADRTTTRIVGAEMFGPRVEHTAHLLAWAIQSRMDVCRAVAMPFYHPVIEEGIRTAIRDLSTKLRISGHCMPEDRADCAGM